MSHPPILAAISQLHREGKAITTAAVKAKLTTAVALSELLPLIARYKSQPELLIADTLKQPPSSLAKEALTLDERVSALEKVVAEQALTIRQLEAQLLGATTQPLSFTGVRE
ncbi:hypothetical protein [Oceanisphaera avium]|uniref:KfrA N-terminal DNA-binding domain-containing protein n=1 Tax=Oceanisphaera avium TaxID=1903694 RepID=A0A1Y0CWL4_9GAMM|nr:hypothetical protein [Oceanisphaera avium]ART79639.1 hypothetical protein CBP12_05295 [Oceanisphaera avium]